MKTSQKDHSLSLKAYTIIRNRILRGELGIGDVISRRKIAVELGMSLLPVMEALLRLEYEGLLESRPRAGTRVRIPTLTDVTGNSVVREALEVQAAKLFSEQATKNERASLLKLALRVDAAAKSDPVLFADLHNRFHRKVVECAHCPALLRALDNSLAVWFTWLTAIFPRLPSHTRAGHDHQELAEVLDHGTVKAAKDKMREHVAMGYRQVMDGMKPYVRMKKSRGDSYSRTANSRPKAAGQE